jgi:spermidine synthase
MTILLCLLFLLSGAAALLFETLWFHQASLALGSSIRASSLVLAGFMGGLALGNALVARFGQTWRQPIGVYALLEVAIAVTGVALVHALPALTPELAPLFARFAETPWLVDTLRLSIAFPMLLVPSTAMGMTLPLLVAALHRRDPNFGRVLGRLYGWNTLGAVIGALAGEVALVAWLGIRGSALVAAGLNLIAAGAAFALSARVDREAASPAPPAASRRLPPRARMLLATAFLLGGILLALEVVWFRFLLLFVHGSSLAFAIMLAVVLLGIGGGSLLAARVLSHRPDAWRLLPAVALTSGLLSLLTYLFFGAMPRISTSDAALRWIDTLAIGTFLMLPVSLLSGALFTGLGVALLRESPGATRTTGLLTLANTTGAMLGSLIGGFVLLPWFGVERSIWILASGYGLTAALLAIGGGIRPADRPTKIAFAVPATLLLLSLAFFPSGLAERTYLRAPLLWFLAGDQSTIVETREGLTETLTYLRRDRFGEPVSYRLVTNGHSMASTMVPSDRYMKLFVYLPVALHPDPRSALLISFGVGSTAKALTDTKGLESIDIVDTSRDVLEMSRIVYPDPATNPLSDPRVTVHVEDGRFFLQTTPRRFDLITGEPPPPKNAGIVNLYTKEYFALIRERLNEGGVASYWLPVHSLLEPDTKSIIRAFCDAFDDCTLWNGASLDWILMGTRNAEGPVSEQQFTRQWRDPGVARELRDLGLERPEQLGATFMADAETLRARSAGHLPLADDHPKRLSETPAVILEMMQVYRPWFDFDAARDGFARSPILTRLWPPGLREATLPYFAWQAVLHRSLYADLGKPVEELPELHRVLTTSDLETLPLWMLGTDADEGAAARAAQAKGRRGVLLDYQLGATALSRRQWGVAARHFAEAQQRAANRELVYYRTYALARAGRDEAARAVSRQAGLPKPGVASDLAFARFARDALGLDLIGDVRPPLPLAGRAPTRVDSGAGNSGAGR